jgi:hypothetical protein
MRILALVGVNEYLVFSNDIAWCKTVFRGTPFTFIEDDSNVELFLMGQCAHNITSNSSFSWWGAYLNNNPDRQIIAPQKWFVTNKYSSRDIVPLKWIKI